VNAKKKFRQMSFAPETPVSYSTNEIRFAASKFKIKIAIFELRSNIDGHDRKSYPKILPMKKSHDTYSSVTTYIPVKVSIIILIYSPQARAKQMHY
jgi:hypothetical protein